MATQPALPYTAPMLLTLLLLGASLADGPAPTPEEEPPPAYMGHCLGILCDSPYRSILGFGAELHAGVPQRLSLALKLRVRLAGSTSCRAAMWNGFVLEGEPGLGGLRGALGYEGVFRGPGMFGAQASINVFHPWRDGDSLPLGSLYVGPSLSGQLLLFTLRGGALFSVDPAEPGARLDLSLGAGF